ncbi:MAG TPA: AEC family transporter [Usitatibacter sp.]|nr:AEC family transporter [Usitatibacter sp.]
MILSVTLPFFALILFGYVAAWRRWVPPEAVPAFNGFLLYFAVPAMLFRFAANTPTAELLNGRFALAWALSGMAVVVLVTFAAVRLAGVRMRDAAFFGLAGGVGNLGFMGVPMMVALLGEGAAAAMILAIVIDNIVVGSTGLALAEMSGATRKGWREDVRDGIVRVVLNPFIVSMVLGAAFSAGGWRLPTFAESIVKLLADSAGPCALFAIGVSLVRPDAPLRSPRLAIPIAAKLLLHPLVVWCAMWIFGIDPFTTLVAVLAAALPSAGWVFIFATRYEADAGRVSAVILLTTALAFATFSSLVWLMGVGRAA